MDVDKCVLFVNGFTSEQTDDEIKEFGMTFGRFNIMRRPEKKRYAFFTYKTESEAAKAKDLFEKNNFRCGYGNIRNNDSKRRPNNNNSKTSVGVNLNGNDQSSDSKSSDNRNGNINEQSNGIQSNNMDNGNRNQKLFKDGQKIIITHVVNQYCFYAVSAEPIEDYHEYCEFMKMISSLGERTMKFDRVPKKHSFALVPLKGKYYRALITENAKPQDEYVPVFFCDIGWKTDIAIEQLNRISDIYNGVRWVFQFFLKDVNRGAHNPDAINHLETFINKEVEIQNVGKNGNETQVELIDPKSNNSINVAMKQFCTKFSVDDLKMREVDVGCNKDILVVDNTLLKQGDNLIAFVDGKHSLEFKKQRELIQAYGKEIDEDQKFAPESDDLCLVKIVGFWYRAAFIEYVRNKAKVYLIDHFRAEYVDVEDIRNISKEYVEMPIISFVASVKDYKPKIRRGVDIITLIDKIKESNAVRVKSIDRSSTEKPIYTVEL